MATKMKNIFKKVQAMRTESMAETYPEAFRGGRRFLKTHRKFIKKSQKGGLTPKPPFLHTPLIYRSFENVQKINKP